MRHDRGGAVITGVIDLLCHDENGELVVVDSKSGAFHDEYRWQLSVYGWCANTNHLVIYIPENNKVHIIDRLYVNELLREPSKGF